MGDTLSKPVETKNITEKILPQHDLIYVSASMQGWRINMEDENTVETDVPGFSNYSFFGVYDGHLGVKVAKYIAANLHLNIFKKLHEFGEENIEKAIKDGFMQTDSDMQMKEGFSSGSTAVIAVITPSQIVYVGNAGDSRAVMSVDGLALPLSVDHVPSNPDESQRIIKAGGYVSYNYNGTGIDRVNGNLSLARSLGDFNYKKNPDIRPEEQIISAYPDVKFHKIEAETDYLVLACDGIWDCKTSQEVIDFINQEIWQHKDLSKACENLLNDCLSKVDNIKKGTDNMTIIIIGFLNGLEKEQWLERIGCRHEISQHNASN